MTQGIEERIRTVPAIEPEFHLFQVGWKMLGGQPMPRSCDTTLEQAESGFNGVGMNVSHDVHPGIVIDSLVILSASLSHGGDVGHMVVRENHVHVLADILAAVFRERAGLRIVSMEESQVAVPLSDAHNYLFSIETMNATLVSAFAANVGNVDFYFSVQHRLIGLRHCVPDAMTEIPCGLVGADSKRALNLAGGHSFLGFTEEERCCEPFFKGQVGIIENRASSNRKLIIAILTVEELLLGFQFDHWAFAAQAARALREAQARQKLAAFGICREQSVYVH